MGYEVLEEPMPSRENRESAKEAFITSTTKAFIARTCKINDHTITQGENMVMTNRLRIAFRAYCDAYVNPD